MPLLWCMHWAQQCSASPNPHFSAASLTLAEAKHASKSIVGTSTWHCHKEAPEVEELQQRYSSVSATLHCAPSDLVAPYTRLHRATQIYPYEPSAISFPAGLLSSLFHYTPFFSSETTFYLKSTMKNKCNHSWINNSGQRVHQTLQGSCCSFSFTLNELHFAISLKAIALHARQLIFKDFFFLLNLIRFFLKNSLFVKGRDS